MKSTAKATDNKPKKKIPSRGNGSSLVAFQKFLKENKNPNAAFEPHVTVLTPEEVAKHNSPSDCWTIYKDHVYNIGPFIEYHPGGADELLRGAGKDCTQLYNRYHPWVNADAVMGKLKLGRLVRHTPEIASIEPGASSLQVLSHSEEAVTHIPPVSATKSSHPNLTIKVSTDTDHSDAPIALKARDVLNRPVGIFRLFNAVKPNQY